MSTFSGLVKAILISVSITAVFVTQMIVEKNRKINVGERIYQKVYKLTRVGKRFHVYGYSFSPLCHLFY